MFCKKCGCEMQEGDVFCGNCGDKVDSALGGSTLAGINTGNTALNELDVVKFFKIYIKKPLSYFENYICKDCIKVSIPLMIMLSVIYGIINMLYSTCVVKAIIGNINDIPSVLAEMGFISSSEATIAKKGMIMSNSWLGIEDKLNNVIDKKDVFLSGFGSLLIIMIGTIIFIAILNSVVLKNKLNTSDILLISTSSYIPLVISLIIGSIGTLISIIFGACLIFSGYILSFITLYNGIKDMSGERKDKVFVMMAILFVLISAVMSVTVVMKFENSMITIGRTLNAFKDFL